MEPTTYVNESAFVCCFFLHGSAFKIIKDKRKLPNKEKFSKDALRSTVGKMNKGKERTIRGSWKVIMTGLGEGEAVNALLFEKKSIKQHEGKHTESAVQSVALKNYHFAKILGCNAAIFYLAIL